MKKIILLLILLGLVFWALFHMGAIHRFAEKLDDGSITAEILSQVAKSAPADLFSIKVKTEHAKVVLNGKLGTEEEKAEIEKIAKNAEGVKAVENHIVSDGNFHPPLSYLKDWRITAAVKRKLIKEEGWAGLWLQVRTTGGIVTLKGKVPSQEQLSLAGKLARQIGGVKDVYNKIQVR